jgi:threonine dehydratase
MIDISLEKISEARKAIDSSVITSPIIPLTTFSPNHRNPIYLKLENLQPSGSFKIRGASYSISLLSDEQKKKGIIAYSTGNHAKACAWAAKKYGVQAEIVMSPDAPDFKLEAVKALGADIIMTEPSSEKRRQVAEELAKSKGYYLLPPYDSVPVITGQATIGLEVLEQIDPAAVFVPVGGGGLIAGIALAIKKRKPHVKIIGVEPELEDDACRSFKEGKLVWLDKASSSIADAIKVLALGNMTFPLIQQYVDDMVTVSEKKIAETTLLLARSSHLIVEPAGALGLAAALSYTKPLPAGPVVAIISGGNTTLSYLQGLTR